MEFFPLGIIIISVFMISLLRGLRAAFYVACAILPLGALAVVTLGNFNLLAMHTAFIILVGLAFAVPLTLPNKHLIPKLELSVLLLSVLTIYVIITSQILPRIFAGKVMVFSLQSGVDGTQISPLLQSQISELSPSSGNISQPVYFLLSALVFVFVLRLVRKGGLSVADKAIIIAASINAFMGLLDLVNLDAVLTLLKTAEYSIFLEAKVAGLPRIVGAFPEASTMGSFSAVMFAYLFMRYLDTGYIWFFILASVNFFWGVLALSSTGFVALAIAIAFIMSRVSLQTISGSMSRDTGFRILLLIVVGTVFFMLLGLLTSSFDYFLIFLDELIFNKSTSLSALERGAWAQRGYEIGIETYGLGAGLGSTRSNGLLAVLISNIGIPGLFLYGMFLWEVLKKAKKSDALSKEQSFYRAGMAGLLTLLVGSFVSGTTADPGILFMILSAIIVASKPAKFLAGPSS